MEKKFCIIIDVQGNFYKLNEKKELVVARCEKDAKRFTVEEATERIGTGKKSHFYNFVELGGTNNKSVDAVINENEVNHFSSIKTMIHELGSLISLFSESHRDIGDYQGELNKKQSMVLCQDLVQIKMRGSAS